MAGSLFPPLALRQITREVTSLLRERRETVAVAETAAGGLISASLLSQPGASKYYKGGLTLYTLDARVKYAGWTQANIDSYDGPTPDLVAGLADYTRAQLGATYVLAESGTAGPTASGKGENRQIGYVAIAVSSEKGTYKTAKETGVELGTGKEREENMLAFAVIALTLLKEVLEGKAKL